MLRGKGEIQLGLEQRPREITEVDRHEEVIPSFQELMQTKG